MTSFANTDDNKTSTALRSTTSALQNNWKNPWRLKIWKCFSEKETEAQDVIFVLLRLSLSLMLSLALRFATLSLAVFGNRNNLWHLGKSSFFYHYRWFSTPEAWSYFSNFWKISNVQLASVVLVETFFYSEAQKCSSGHRVLFFFFSFTLLSGF